MQIACRLLILSKKNKVAKGPSKPFCDLCAIGVSALCAAPRSVRQLQATGWGRRGPRNSRVVAARSSYLMTVLSRPAGWRNAARALPAWPATGCSAGMDPRPGLTSSPVLTAGGRVRLARLNWQPLPLLFPPMRSSRNLMSSCQDLSASRASRLSMPSRMACRISLEESHLLPILNVPPVVHRSTKEFRGNKKDSPRNN